jgi:DnaJ homologue, subfamily C, member 28, conserved domain
MSGLPLLDTLAEARIEEALAAGAFDDLPGAGRPLELDDDRLVPEEVRAAYRILRRAGFVPPEVEARKEMASLVTLIATLEHGAERRRALDKLAFIQARLEARKR